MRGDRVIATMDISGGWLAESVPQGTEGVVVDPGGWTSPMRVAFTFPAGFFRAEEVVTIAVSDEEIARI